MMEDTELDDGFVQVREQLGNSNGNILVRTSDLLFRGLEKC